MKDQNANTLLATVMGWETEEPVLNNIKKLMLLADYKYDHYQRFGPGRRFIESLALWLNQFEKEDRESALKLVNEKLIFISDNEFFHLVKIAYPDVILQERLRIISEEIGCPDYKVGMLSEHNRFKELAIKTLYLGLSDGAKSSDLRRASKGEINNEQIWQAYELGPGKVKNMLESLRDNLVTFEKRKCIEVYGEEDAESHAKERISLQNPRFNIVWLLDDFSASGNTYIRWDNKIHKWKGKISRIYEQLNTGEAVDTSYYEIFLLLYVATRQAIDHIEYWSERFTTEKGFKPLKVKVVHVIEDDYRLNMSNDPSIGKLIEKESSYDENASDKHIEVGGTQNARWGFASCSLPVILSHNTPNNSIYILWGPEEFKPFGLFPRMSRHREF